MSPDIVYCIIVCATRATSSKREHSVYVDARSHTGRDNCGNLIKVGNSSSDHGYCQVRVIKHCFQSMTSFGHESPKALICTYTGTFPCKRSLKGVYWNPHVSQAGQVVGQGLVDVPYMILVTDFSSSYTKSCLKKPHFECPVGLDYFVFNRPYCCTVMSG